MRRGVVLVTVAVLLIVLFGFTALCIDIGWASVSKNELQNAADASAAAGVSQLLTNYGAYQVSTTTNQNKLLNSTKSSTVAYCTKYAGYNRSGDVSSLSLLANDIQIGSIDSSGNFQANGSGYPNTVKVLVRRDQSANKPLPLFFAPVIGTSNLDLSATSSATVYSGLISAFNPNGGGEGPSFIPSGPSGSSSGGNGNWATSYGSSTSSFNCTLLPLAFDVNHWNQFFANGTSPDGSTYLDSNFNPQLKVYPSPKNSPGNFGLLCIGPWTNATPVYANWVLNGPSASDIQALVNAGSFPVSLSNPKPWKGSPGLRTSLSSYFTQIIGRPRLLPLFQPATQSPYQAASGSGSNTTYSIVGFAGVTINSVSGSGTNLNISVVPCDVIDPTAVFDSASLHPLGTEPATQLKTFTHPAPKFTN